MADKADTATLERPRADPAREQLRALVRQEVAARRPKRIARRTLELLAEAAIEPASGDPAYRIVGHNGTARLRPGGEEGAPPQPLTLAELVAELAERLPELAERHPALFEPPEPEPAPAAGAPVPARTAPDLAAAADAAAKLREDAARYIELQSAKARVVSRSLAARSSARGRILAASAGSALTNLRGRAAAGKAARAAPADPVPVLAPGATDPASTPAPSTPLGDRLRTGTAEAIAHARDRLARANDSLDGRWMLGGATAAAVLVAAVVLVGTARENADVSPATSRDQAAAPATPSPQPAPAAPAAEDAKSPSPIPQPAPPAASPATPPPEAEPETPQPQPGEITGPADVVDTATLRVGGKLMRLFGVEWVRGGNAADLTRYLAGRPVTCQKAPGSENFTCTVEGRDLSEVVLFNGGGRASPEAGSDLVAAEDHARTERLGVWKR